MSTLVACPPPGFGDLSTEEKIDSLTSVWGRMPHGRFEERHRLRRRPARAIGIGNPVPAARGAHMLAQELTDLRIEEAHEEVVPTKSRVRRYLPVSG